MSGKRRGHLGLCGRRGVCPSGRQLDELASGEGHWNSPIVVDGRIARPEGNANDHATRGVLDIWRLARHWRATRRC
jgi:hypothetical protein